MTDEAVNLLREASLDLSGKIWFLRLSDEVIRISTNGKHMVQSNEADTRMKWETAMKDLEGNGYIKAFGHSRKCFTMTKKGYELVRSMSTVQSF